MLRLATLLCLIGSLATAAPERYRLDAASSDVGFTYYLDGSAKTGRMPVQSADIVLDLDNVSNSTVSVVLEADRARAGFIFATEAMKGASVLHTDKFPDIRFHSTAVQGTLNGADVVGNLTVRGVTMPVTLRAGLFRQRTEQSEGNDRLIVQLTGSISRSAFGASGYSGMVDDRIDLNIIAQVTK